ncbi:FGGY-family carbohydrate kinase [Neorhizobium sp. NPDC001467]|uniref:FGGY-family carbohydrate kinase n=1 Tax=Neorhizobium sp. NPDC001467 TaxID=3390595 RepID=UPI003D00865A
MSIVERIAVLDIGKTNVKVVIIDAVSGMEIAAVRMANHVLAGPPYPHYDVEGIWSFVLDALAQFALSPGYDAISIATHGACAALLDSQGRLALPVLDYEHEYPQQVRDAYAAIRPNFAQTASPFLPGGLNLGAQLHYQKAMFPADFARVATIVTYPQYWAFRLTGVAANEATSLGCHTDLWKPASADHSDLVAELGLSDVMAPVRSAFDRLGTLLPEIAQRIGTTRPVSVFCGIHDSNASLLPHLLRRDSPFAVVSTGTWVVSFAVGGNLAGLDPARDTLANVDAFGRAVPSSRFMGGREFELLTSGWPQPADEDVAAAVDAMLATGRMLLPAVVQGSGPFARHKAQFIGDEPRTAAEMHALASIYIALMTETCLSLLDARGDTIVEGPLAGNASYLRLLAGLTGRNVLAVSGSTGTGSGAALLAGVPPAPVAGRQIEPGAIAPVAALRRQWRQRLEMMPS